jgi:ribosomal protein S18 acetylase RimI-like enzyme|tara:strand:+ start:111 stop:824 length:714 start_codon:yes stop_codon:yes gene_type:complete
MRAATPLGDLASRLAQQLDELASFSGGSRSIQGITIRPARRADALQLADLCTDSFYGTHALQDGPIIFLQRLKLFVGVYYQVSRRLGFETDGERECRLFVAQTDEGRVCGCADLAVHLFDGSAQRFRLEIDEMPEGGEGQYRWAPYVCSLAVDGSRRRGGVGRALMRECERTAKQWGNRELLLEVAQTNVGAIRFYERLGYKVLASDGRGTGAMQVDVRPFWWDVYPVRKYVMRRPV